MQRMLVVLARILFLAGSVIAQEDTLTILHLNDTHSTLAPIGPRDVALQGTHGGIARAATAIASVRADRPNALLLHAGDFSIGDLFYNVTFAVPELKILAGLGCDALTLGNHEFDLTPSSLQMTLDSAFTDRQIPVLSANLLLPDTALKGLSRHIFPFVIRKVGSHLVGIFGLTTPSANVLSRPAPAVLDTGILRCASALVDSLKGRGCDAVLLLSHLGLSEDRRVAAAVAGITLIIGGHDHYRLEQPVAVRDPLGDTTWIVQAHGFYTDLGIVQLSLAAKKARMLRSGLLPLDAGVKDSSTVASLVRSLTEKIEQRYGPVYSRQIALCDTGFGEVAPELREPGWKDTPVGNLVSDAFRSALKTQVAVEAGGSTAQNLYAGPVVAADLFRMVGYGFNTENGLGYRMATWEIKGTDLRSGLEFGVSSIDVDDEYLLQVSGMRYVYDPSRPAGSRIVSVTIASRPMEDSLWYSVASNEFALSFLRTIGIPVRNVAILTGDATEFQVVASYVSGAARLKPVREGRVEARILPELQSP